MLILRLLALLTVIAVVGGLVIFMFTGDRRYLRFSWRVFRYGVAIGLLLLAFVAAERLLVIPW